VRERVVVEHDPADPFLAGEHAHDEEQNEDRQPHAGGQLARRDAED
jgi:hypothetical protein